MLAQREGNPCWAVPGINTPAFMCAHWASGCGFKEWGGGGEKEGDGPAVAATAPQNPSLFHADLDKPNPYIPIH